jgi:hypothetical protein
MSDIVHLPPELLRMIFQFSCSLGTSSQLQRTATRVHEVCTDSMFWTGCPIDISKCNILAEQRERVLKLCRRARELTMNLSQVHYFGPLHSNSVVKWMPTLRFSKMQILDRNIDAGAVLISTDDVYAAVGCNLTWQGPLKGVCVGFTNAHSSNELRISDEQEAAHTRTKFYSILIRLDYEKRPSRPTFRSAWFCNQTQISHDFPIYVADAIERVSATTFRLKIDLRRGPNWIGIYVSGIESAPRLRYGRHYDWPDNLPSRMKLAMKPIWRHSRRVHLQVEPRSMSYDGWIPHYGYRSCAICRTWAEAQCTSCRRTWYCSAHARQCRMCIQQTVRLLS